MMKKVLFGVAMALLASVSVGTLQSCKDDVSDLKTQTSFNLVQLQQDLNNVSNDLQRQITNNKNNITAILGLLGDYAKVQWVQDQLDALNADIKDKYDDLVNRDNNIYNALNGAIQTNYGKIQALTDEQLRMANQIAGALNSIDALNGRVDGLNTSIGNLSAAFSGLQDRVAALEEAIKDCVKDEDFQNLVGRVEANEAAIDLINETLEGVKSDIVDINDQLSANSESIENLKYKMMLLKREVAQLKEDMVELRNDLDALTTRVDDLETALKDLTNQVDQIVSGLLIQSVNSPVFGDFSLPIGIKSNILFNWYGFNKASRDVAFPSNNGAYSATGVPGVDFTGAPAMDDNDLIKAGSYYPANVKLGTVYVTVNPIGSKYKDLKLSVVNSLGEAIPDLDVTLNPSQKLLTHGYSRAEEAEEAELGKIDSNVYEGEVTVDPTNAEQFDKVRISIDDKLETSMKDAIKDPSKHTAVALFKALYDQMSGMLPAYALNYSWEVAMSDPEVSPKAYAVLSQYDLAVATAHPLGYNFLEGKGSSKQLPTIGALDNMIYSLKDKVNIEISDIQLEDFSINFTEGLQVSVSGVDLFICIPELRVLDENNDPYVKTIVLSTKDLKNNNALLKEELEKHGYNYTPATVEYDVQLIDGMGSLQSALQTSIVNALDQVGGKVSSQLKDQIQNQINNNVIGALQKNINTQISNVIDEFAGKLDPYFNKANRAFDIYNKIANKVNKFLKNPNAYLQVTALYSMNGDYGFVSGKPGDPSVYNGSDAFSIYLTSYTGELIVPAYKKYVAVTGKVVNGKVEPINVTNPINSGELNTILDGNQVRVEVPVANFESGAVYELTYQAVDYRGYTSTRKMYVQVNK